MDEAFDVIVVGPRARGVRVAQVVPFLKEVTAARV
jgi:hypothetical protein